MQPELRMASWATTHATTKSMKISNGCGGSAKPTRMHSLSCDNYGQRSPNGTFHRLRGAPFEPPTLIHPRILLRPPVNLSTGRATKWHFYPRPQRLEHGISRGSPCGIGSKGATKRAAPHIHAVIRARRLEGAFNLIQIKSTRPNSKKPLLVRPGQGCPDRPEGDRESGLRHLILVPALRQAYDASVFSALCVWPLCSASPASFILRSRCA